MSDKPLPLSSLHPVHASTLKLGMALPTTLYDEEGRLLLNRNHVIDTPKLLRALQEHPALYTDTASSQATTKAILSGFDAATRLDVPLKDLDKVTPVVQPLAAPTEAPRERPVVRTLPQIWTDLEDQLRVTLGNLSRGGEAAGDALRRLDALVARVQAQMRSDRDGSLFVLINRAVTDYTGYSTLHALVCAALADDLAKRLPISATQTERLVRAALTMNVSARSLQDQMAGQKTRATQSQLMEVDAHPGASMRTLQQAGVNDPLWLAVVERHHDDLPHCPALNDRPEVDKLVKVLQVIDRYTAAMSPRGTRPGREAREAMRSVIRSPGSTEHDEVGLDLMQNVGLYPPGTYVALARGDVAVVLKRGRRPQEPLVAPVLNPRGEPVLEPRALPTDQEGCAIRTGLSGSAVKVRVNEAHMLRHIASARTGLDGP